MVPKEKAEELIIKFMNHSFHQGSLPQCRDHAKQCALIAVDEILTSKQTAYPNQVIELGQVFYSYWQEVKTEINK